jgi:ubiquinol-cytochrome c reductase cytochrome b subunit
VIAVPLVLVMLVFLHIVALHEVGSNNPDGIEIKKTKDANGIPLDGIPFHPYFTVKDIVGVAVFLLFFSTVMFYMPEMNGFFLEHANFIPADPMKTPEHIAPVWYFTPFYAILRAIPDKFAGVIAMFGSIVVLFLLPWLDRGPVKSIRYRGGIYKKALALFVLSFIVLGYLGTQPATHTAVIFARIFTAIYFGFFLLMPIYTRWEKTKPEPKRVTVQPDYGLEECFAGLQQVYGEITTANPVKAKNGANTITRRPNFKGILNVITRFAKKIKASFD